MPCYDPQSSPHRTYSEGYTAGKNDAIKQVSEKLNEANITLNNARDEIRNLNASLCAVFNNLSEQQGLTVEGVIDDLNLTEDLKEYLNLWWVQHQEQDLKRVKRYMDGWNERDKVLALKILNGDVKVD